jgi:hypothetical protein
MIRICKIFVALPAVLFVVIGLRWLVDPASVSVEFGFVLADGLGRSSQVGDMSAFFLTLGICILMALVSGRRLWYYPPVMLLLLATIGRVLSWLVHDAAFAGSMIAIEVFVAAILLAAARWLPGRA